MEAIEELSNPEHEACLRSLVDWVASQDTDMTKALAAKWSLQLLAQAVNEVSASRMQAVRGLWSQGWSLADMSEALGVSRARIHQIIEK